MVRVEVRTMINISGFGRRGYLSLKPAACAILTLVTLSAAGCSADVTRFDSASFNLDDPQSAEGPPVPPEPVHTGSLSSAASAGVSRTQPRGPMALVPAPLKWLRCPSRARRRLLALHRLTLRVRSARMTLLKRLRRCGRSPMLVLRAVK